jgi:6-phospho-beta-glucosidase
MLSSMKEPRIVIAIVGGGVYAARLCEALARTTNVPDAELRLSARDRGRLGILAAHARGRLRTIKPGWSVTTPPSLEAAVEGAAAAILLVRVGGFAARAWDEEFPRRYGLVGDEGLGPGGIANAWRTLPKLEAIADAIRRTAPGARVINLMAPLGMTTRLLLNRGVDGVGICELPAVTLQHWLSRAGAQPEEARWRYAGLNPLGWFWDVEAGGRDVLRLLLHRGDVASSHYPLDGATLDRFQAAPLRYYYEIFDAEARARLHLERRPGRARELSALAETLLERFASSPGADHPEEDLRPTPWLDLAVAPIAAALLGGPPHAGFANVRNNGLIPELSGDLIVELPAGFTSGGVTPVGPGPLPENVAAFLRKVGDAEMLAYTAAEQSDPELLVEAIRALPLPIPDAAAPKLAELVRAVP